MNTEQRSNIIAGLSGIINDDRIAQLEKVIEHRSRYLTVVLDDIYIPQNASAVIRTSECIGLQDIHIIEERNKHKTNRDIVKGSAKWVDIYRYENKDGRSECIEKLKQQDYRVVAMTLSEKSIPLEELPIDEKLALCFGCKETGLSKEIEDNTDYQVQIPITGFTQSYNISVSAGISLYYLMKKIKDTNQNWQLNKEEKEKLLIDWLSKSTPAGRALLGRYKEETEKA